MPLDRTSARRRTGANGAGSETARAFACIPLAFEEFTLSQDTTDAGSAPATDPRIHALPDIHGHPKGEHRPYAEERPIPYSARMLFLWFFHACRRGSPRFMMVSDHINYLTFEDPAAVNLVRRALKLAQAGDLYGAAETAGVEITHAAVVSEGLRRGMRYSIGAEVDNDPRSRPDAQNIVDAMKPDGLIRSVHFLPIVHPEHGEGWLWPFDNPEFVSLFEVVGVERTWELYVETLLAALESQPAQILGHFYVPAKFGHWPDQEKLEAYEDRIIEICREREIAIELNSRAFYRNQDEAQHRRYREANARLLKKAKAAGVLIAVGSDAHSPRDQGRAFEIVLQMLDEAEINELAFPIGGRLAKVALRASKELLEQRRNVAPASVGSSITGLGRAELVARGVTLPPENEIADRSEAAARQKAKRAASAAAAAAEAAEAPAKPARRTKAQPAEAPETAQPADAAIAAAEPVRSQGEAPVKKPKSRPASRKKTGPATEPEAEAPATAAAQAGEAAATEAAPSPEAGQAPLTAEPPAPAKRPARAKPSGAAKAAAPAKPSAAAKAAAPAKPAAASAKPPAAKAPAPAAKPSAAKPPAKAAKAAAAAKKAPAKAPAPRAKAKPVARAAAKSAPPSTAGAKKAAAPKKAAPAARAKAPTKARPAPSKAAKPAVKTAKSQAKASAKAPAKTPPKPAAKVAQKAAKAKPKGKASPSKATRKRR